MVCRGQGKIPRDDPEVAPQFSEDDLHLAAEKREDFSMVARDDP